MSEKIDRALARGGDVKVVPKEVNVEGLYEISKQLMAMGVSQELTSNALIDSLNQITAVIKEKELHQGDMHEVLSAIRQLKIQAIHNQSDYVVEFERNSKGQIKSGLQFKRLN